MDSEGNSDVDSFKGEDGFIYRKFKVYSNEYKSMISRHEYSHLKAN